VRELLRELAPGAFVSVSHEVAPRPGEYPRTVATVINSLIGPVMEAYLDELESSLRNSGYLHDLQLMTCSGGVINLEDARLRPVLTIGSGPAAGVMGARTLAAAHAAASNGNTTSSAITGAVTTDMGGTTLDVGVIRGTEPLRRGTSRHGQYEYFVPTVDVRSIGAGGGSIIRFDDSLGSLTVGPQSAGSRPGPACYGRGGTEPTVTDADVVLGYLNPDYFLEGRMALDAKAAVAALERVGKHVNMDAEQTAAAAIRIIENQMADAIRLASVQQGYDPRDFVLYAYGGAGPVHAGGYARELGVKKVVVPLSDFASGWSAFGIATSEAVVVREIGRAMTAPFDPEVLNETWAPLEAEVTSRLIVQGAAESDIQLERLVEMKYAMQVHQLPVRAPGGLYDDAKAADLLRAFDEEYDRVFGEGAGYSAAGYALTALRVIGRADIVHYSPRVTPLGADGGAPKRTGEREILLYEGADLLRVTTPTYDGKGFTPGMALDGPAIVEFPDTTVVLKPGQSASVDQFNSVNIAIG
jgi:N-methylhydantoinase A